MALQKAVTGNVLFSHLESDELTNVLDAMFLVVKHAGDVIIQQGDDGDNFYIIDSGTVEVSSCLLSVATRRARDFLLFPSRFMNVIFVDVTRCGLPKMEGRRRSFLRSTRAAALVSSRSSTAHRALPRSRPRRPRSSCGRLTAIVTGWYIGQVMHTLFHILRLLY